MHTGYDNFWMNKNSRLKPVLNLPQNDNYSCALLTDNYKHMQNGGCPSHLNSFIPPQNNAASSHAKDHYRNSYDQSMWPSSVYSLPFMPSYANNLPPQQPFFTHTNNYVYSSPNNQVQEKHDFRHLEMSNGNANLLTTHNTNTSTLASNGLAHAQNNKDTNPQIPRIRVKDVYSLNNKSVQIQLESDGHFGIGQQKEPTGCATHHNRALEARAQMEYMRYKNAHLVESSKSSQHFEHRTAQQTCLNNQEQFQNSCSLYQQNNGSSLGNFEFSGSRQTGNSLPSESFRSSTCASLLSQLLSQESILERGLQNCQGNAGGQVNAQRGHGGEKVTPVRNLPELNSADYSASDYSRSCGLNEGAPENGTNLRNLSNAHCDLQKNLPNINEVHLKSPTSASNIMSKNAPSVISKSPPLKEINNQQNSLIKISIPHTGQTIFNDRDDDDDEERNSGVSLQSFFEESDKNCATNRNTHYIGEEEKRVVPSIPPSVGQSSLVNRHASPEATSVRDGPAKEDCTGTNRSSVPGNSPSFTSTPRNLQVDAINRRLHRREFDALGNKDDESFRNSTGAPEMIQQKFAEISRGEDSTAEHRLPTSDFTATPLTLKQEILHSEIDCAQNPPEDQEFHPTIKTEENSENLTELECDLELHLEPPDVVDEALAKFQVEGCSSANKSGSDSAQVTESEDDVDKANILESGPRETGEVQNLEKKEGVSEVGLSRVNYKSNINRHKLDLLIQFLKKDGDSSESRSCSERLVSCGETTGNADDDSCRRRRKLNKASIVRNKNNSREMISLMSLKGPHFTSKPAQIAEGSKNVEKSEDGKGGCSTDRVTGEERFDAGKESGKRNGPWEEKESKKEVSLEPESPRNETECLGKGEPRESSGKPGPKGKCSGEEESAVISTVRAFQNCKTHFCLSCKLVSSMESFWVNVVSGEVRCLNCFKRMSLKGRGNVSESKSKELQDSSVKGHRKRKSETEKENKSKDSGSVGGSNSWDEGGMKRSSKCEDALRKLNGMKENVRQELLEIFVSAKRKSNERKETTNCPCHKRRGSSSGEVHSQKGKPSEEKVLKTEKSAASGCSSEESVGRGLSENGTNQGVKDVNAKRKRINSSGEEECAKRERHFSSIKQGKTSSPKEQYSENGAKEANVMKSEKSHGRRSSRSEEASECRGKKETKGGGSSNAGEEFRWHRGVAVEERGQRDPKARHCTDEWKRPPGGESCPGRKEHAAEEAPKRSGRHEAWDKWKKHNSGREGRDEQRAKGCRAPERRDPKAAEAPARGSSSQPAVQNQKRTESSEQPRKRKNSEEELSAHKVHVLEESTRRESAQTTQPSKSSEAKASKEKENSQRANSWKARISAEKFGRGDASKEECFLFGEHLRKEAKPGAERAKEARKGLAGPQTGNPWEAAKWAGRKSREEQRGPQMGVGPRRRSSEEESAVPKARMPGPVGGERKGEGSAGQRREKRRSEEEEEEGSRSWRASWTGPEVPGTPPEDGQWRRPEGSSRVFAGKQSSKATVGAPHWP